MTQIVPYGFSTRRDSKQPGTGEGVIGGEAVEAVPVVVDRIDLGLVGTVQIALELEIVGRVGEDHVDRFFRQPLKRRDAVALEDRIEPFGARGYGEAHRQAWLT